MRRLLLVSTLLLATCGSPLSPPPANMQAIGVGDRPASSANQEFHGVVQAAPVTGTEVRFHLDKSATVLVLAYITFASDHDYIYPNLVVDGQDGGIGGVGHHFAATDSDSGKEAPSVSASWARVETLAAGDHSAGLTMDVDPETTAVVFRGMVRVFRLN